MMSKMFSELFQYRELLLELTKRNITIRYKQTIMGFLWALFMPLLIVLSGIVIKKAMAMFSGRPLELEQLVSVMVKALPWAFFVGAIKSATNSLVGNMALIKKIYFAREVLPFSNVLTQLFDFIVAACVLTVLLIIAKIGISIHIIWLPLLLLFFILFTTGLGMILSCANLFFRDVRYIVDSILMFGIFFTPVFYEANMFGKWEKLLLLNPVASILENINNVVVLHKMPDFLWLAYTALWATIGFFGAWFIFHKLEPEFAENI